VAVVAVQMMAQDNKMEIMAVLEEVVTTTELVAQELLVKAMQEEHLLPVQTMVLAVVEVLVQLVQMELHQLVVTEEQVQLPLLQELP
jgi:hypothetical protein